MNKKNDYFDVLIIGGGPAGIFAAYLAYVKGLKALLIESNECLGGQPIALYSQKLINDYPGFKEIKAYELLQSLIKQLKTTDTEILLSTQLVAQKIDGNIYQITLSNDRQIECGSIIIASGIGAFQPNELEIDVDKNINIKYIVDDINNFKNKRVVVLGGGDSAVDWSNELATSLKAKSVTVIHRRNEFRASGENVKKLIQNKIKTYLDSQILCINNKSICIVQNSSNDKTKIPFDVILVQYGQKVDNSLLTKFPKLKINQQNRIPVEINQTTNISNIYAIGNICIYEDKPSSIICAHGEAAVAIRSILNRKRKYDK